MFLVCFIFIPMKRKILFCLFLIIPSFFLNAQEKWSLQQCVNYALSNNISVKQADVQARFAALQLQQDKLGQLPSLGLQSNIGYRFGRSENPTTGILENNNFLSSGFSLSTSTNLFNWFAVQYGIEASKYALEAEKTQVKKVQDDVALNVAVAYLQALVAKEQIKIVEVQAQQTASQLDLTRKQVDAGNLPELNAAELDAQLATDSSSLINAIAAEQQALLQLKAVLNLDAGKPFDIETPSVSEIPVDNLAELQPEYVFQMALKNLSQAKVNNLRMLSYQHTAKAARSNMYPAFSLYGSVGSNYVNIRSPQFQLGAKGPTGATVNIGGIDYDVLAPTTIFAGEEGVPLFKQLRNNFGQSVGITISAPIFNNGVLRTNWQRAQLNVNQWQLQIEQDNQTLKQDIYRAYNDAVAAIQKYNAISKSVQAADKAFNFAQKRYNLNLLSTYELLNSQSRLLQARIEMLTAQYDYVFKLKLLEFYKGQGLKL